jgi:uncharacterized membrane protein
MAQESHDKRGRNYTSIPFEILVAALTILPFFLLAYFYPVLSDRVPLFMKLNGEVAVWGEKTVLSVFRVPLLAVVTQVVFLVMKYGSVQFIAAAPHTIEHSELQERQLTLSVRLWDWFRWTAAFKMSSESVETVFLSVPRFNSLARPTFIITVIATLIGVVGALLYLYRLLVVTRKMKKQFGVLEKPVDTKRVYWGILYFNRSDPALFVSKYGINFANLFAGVLIACVIAYFLLVFLPG